MVQVACRCTLETRLLACSASHMMECSNRAAYLMLPYSMCVICYAEMDTIPDRPSRGWGLQYNEEAETPCVQA